MPADPSSLAMRPQYGSHPYHEHLHSWLSATLRAPASASASLTAPVTDTMTALVAPSASRTIWLASEKQATSTTLARSPVSTGPAAPDAIRITVSLVDVQPSTLMRLKLRSTPARRICCSTSGSTAASV